MDHVVRTDKMVHLVCLDLLESLDLLEIRDHQVSRVLPASLEDRVLAVMSEASVLEVLPVLRDSSDSLDRLAHLETLDLKVSRELREFQEQQASLVRLVILVVLASKDLQAAKVCFIAIDCEPSYMQYVIIREKIGENQA